MRIVLNLIRRLPVYNCHLTFRPYINYSRHPPTLLLLKSLQTNHRRLCTISSTHCWKCGQKLSSRPPQYFCASETCKAIQPVTDNLSYFNLFGLVNEFKIDNKTLTEVYRSTMNQLHPDKTVGWSGREKEYADLHSSLVNKAYKTLQKPVPRALYLLKLHGLTIEENELTLETEFLMEMLEFNEKVATTTDPQELEDLFNTNRQSLTTMLDNISGAFLDNELQLALRLVAHAKYLLNIEEQIKRKTFLH